MLRMGTLLNKILCDSLDQGTTDWPNHNVVESVVESLGKGCTRACALRTESRLTGLIAWP